MVNGNELRIRIGGEVLSSEKTSSLTVSNSLVEVTTMPTGQFTEVTSGIKSGSISFTHLYSFLGTELEVGDTIAWIFSNGLSGWQGSGVVESIDVSAPSDGIIEMSGNIATTGTIIKYVPVFEDFFLLRENGDFILLESGDKLEITVQTN